MVTVTGSSKTRLSVRTAKVSPWCLPGVYTAIGDADEIEVTGSVASGVDELESLGVELVTDW